VDTDRLDHYLHVCFGRQFKASTSPAAYRLVSLYTSTSIQSRTQMAAQVNLPSHPDYVYFKSVDRVQCRPILRGDKAKPTFDSIPTIDVSPISSPDLEVRQKLAEEIGRAAKDVGFFYLVNPPVSGDKMGTSDIDSLVSLHIG
jgi:hypothetical protein